MNIVFWYKINNYFKTLVILVWIYGVQDSMTNLTSFLLSVTKSDFRVQVLRENGWFVVFTHPFIWKEFLKLLQVRKHQNSLYTIELKFSSPLKPFISMDEEHYKRYLSNGKKVEEWYIENRKKNEK